MTALINIEVKDEMQEKIDNLVRKGLFANRTDVAREGLRRVIKEFTEGV